MKKFLVTGAGGFIGRSLVNALSNNKDNLVIAMDNNFRGSLRKIEKSKNIEKVKADILSERQIKHCFKGVDTCFHLAAINGTKNFYNHPKKVLETGVEGTLNVIKQALANNLKNFIFFSSSEAYQKPKKIPTTELEELKIPDVYNPRLSYGGSKIIGELITINYLKKSNIKYKIIRPHNVYGPDMGGDHVLPELINKISKQKKNINIKIKIFGSGNESRSFIYIDDAIDGILKIYEKGAQNNVYNLGTNQEIKIKKLIKNLGKILNKKIEIKPDVLHRGSVSRRCPDVTKLGKLGHKNNFSLVQGLKETIKFYY